jgi:hypothetical protein
MRLQSGWHWQAGSPGLQSRRRGPGRREGRLGERAQASLAAPAPGRRQPGFTESLTPGPAVPLALGPRPRARDSGSPGRLLNDVSIPELKKSTNLKLLLKSSVQMKSKSQTFAVTVHCSGTPCRRSSAEIEFRQFGRLARGRVLAQEKQPSEVGAGPPLGAKALKSLQDSKHDGPLLKRQNFKIQALVNQRVYGDLKPPLLPK